MPPEQHVIDLGLVESEGVAVVVPPLHHEIVTATVEGDRPAPQRRKASSARSPISTTATRSTPRASA